MFQTGRIVSNDPTGAVYKKSTADDNKSHDVTVHVVRKFSKKRVKNIYFIFGEAVIADDARSRNRR